MSAVETMGEPQGLAGLVPAGSPVVAGRVHLGRLRSQLPVDETMTVLVGFASVVWLGDPTGSAPPGLGPMVYRSEATVTGGAEWC